MVKNPIIIIPARLNSTRLPRKALAAIRGLPMIVQTWRRACDADVGPVLVACCGQEIAAVVEDAGGKAFITDPSVPSGTDRIWSALRAYDPAQRFDAIINVQGDQPFIPGSAIVSALTPLAQHHIGTLAAPISDPQEIGNPNTVKVALSLESPQSGRALYFSRAPIPYQAKTYYHHVGVYAYQRHALETFVNLPPSPLEKTEKLEQLRALEAGLSIGVSLIDQAPISIDTSEDLMRANAEDLSEAV